MLIIFEGCYGFLVIYKWFRLEYSWFTGFGFV